MLIYTNLYFKATILNNKIYKFAKFLFDYYLWKKKNFEKYFIPQKIKEDFILKNSIKNALWIETGTYLGVTANIIKKNSNKLYTIEAEKKLYQNSKKIFKNDKNVVPLYGQSVKCLKKILPEINCNVNFFLDAHNVNNNSTITYKNYLEITPLEKELKIIFRYKKNYNKFVIFIDDISLIGKNKIKKIITYCRRSKISTKFFYNMLKINN